MAELKKSKKKKREHKERRYTGEQTYASKVHVLIGVVGGLGLGAGVYSQWISDQARTSAPYLVIGGGLLMIGTMLFGDIGTTVVRVGDGGVALEKGRDLVRILWCDLKRVRAKDGKLVLEGDEETISVPIAGHPGAVARILAEGTRRVPEAMDVKRSALAGLPEPSEHDGGEILTLETLQVAGRHCAASDRPIAFERDARLCPQCCQVYLRDEVPKKCVTCEAELGDRAVRA
jgi:F0F1-type ATP synthase assembly protein I